MGLNLDRGLSMTTRLVPERMAEIDVALFCVSRQYRVRAVAGRRCIADARIDGRDRHQCPVAAPGRSPARGARDRLSRP